MKAQERCERAGRKQGKRAASWYFDGNTTDATYEHVLRGIEDGNPAILDSFPYLDISGQWADGMTDANVLDDCGYADAEGMLEREPERATECIDAYRDGHDTAVQHEIERMCRVHILSVNA